MNWQVAIPGDSMSLTHPEAVDALEKLIPEAKGQVQFVFVRELVK